MKAITFLGTGTYKETTYYFDDKTATPANLFPKALCELFRPDQVLVMVTKQAKAKWFDQLKDQLTPLCLTPIPVDIPEGHKVSDLWKIFDALTQHLEEGDEVIFDITHSFRTLPLLSFLAASYLRVARNVTLKGIYYGAWEARTPPPPANEPLSSSPTDRSPVFDLTPFVKLLDWTTATDQFVKSGDAKGISDLIKSDGGSEIPHLNSLAASLNNIATGLNALRPLSVMEESAKLKRAIKDAQTEIRKKVPPLTTLLQRIEHDYSRFALRSPRSENPQTSVTRLINQLRMVEWYEARGHLVQALSLARESIVSLVCLLLHKDSMSENHRGKVEEVLKKYYTSERGIELKNQWKMAISEQGRESIHKFWGGEVNRNHFEMGDSPDLASLRNDVMHAGQTTKAKPLEQTMREGKFILTEFRRVVGQILQNEVKRSP